MDTSQAIVGLLQIATIAFLVENLIEIPNIYWGNSQSRPKIQIPKWLKPVLAFLAGAILSFVFGVRLADAIGLSYVEAVAEYADIFDSILFGLVLARGSGLWNKLLKRQK